MKDEMLAQISSEVKGVADAVSANSEEMKKVTADMEVSGNDMKQMQEGLTKQQEQLDQVMVEIQKSGVKGEKRERAELDVKYNAAFTSLLRGDIEARDLKGIANDYKDALIKVAEMSGDAEAVQSVKGMAADSFANGGVLVPVQVANAIIEKQRDMSDIRGLANVQTSDIGGLILPIERDDFGFSWVGERETRAETANGTLGSIEISMDEANAEVHVTNRMQMNGGFNVTNWVSTRAADRLTRGEGNAFLLGDGHKKPMGMLSYGVTGENAVEQITTLATTTISHKDLTLLKAGVRQKYRKNGRYLMNRFTEAYLENLEDGSNRPLFDNYGSIAQGITPTLKGYPYSVMDDMAGASVAGALTANDLVMIYGDIREFYTIIDHNLSMSMIVDNVTVKGSTIFSFSKFVGGGVANFDAAKILKVKS